MKTMKAMSRGAITTAVMVASLATATVAASAASTPSTGTRPALPASCVLDAGPVSVHGRAIYLWFCGGSGWHGQIANGTGGDQVYLFSLARGKVGLRTIPDGQTSVNTPDVGVAGGPWYACGKAWDRSEVQCAGPGDGQ